MPPLSTLLPQYLQRHVLNDRGHIGWGEEAATVAREHTGGRHDVGERLGRAGDAEGSAGIGVADDEPAVLHACVEFLLVKPTRSHASLHPAIQAYGKKLQQHSPIRAHTSV